MNTEATVAIRGVYDSVNALRDRGISAALEDYVAQLTMPLLTGHHITHSTINAVIVGEVARILREKKHLTESEYTAVAGTADAVVDRNKTLLPGSNEYFRTLAAVGREMAICFVDKQEVYPQELAGRIADAELMISRDRLMHANIRIINGRRPHSA